ncbi:MAG: vWA domain-containing protein [Candidatus Delongbacteria bacterium]|jgi:hypothetical protein|nr:vWA domain-containing protein [Candidatus Delongbacteria bacterium]
MPKKDHTQLICVLDRSGSMESVADDAIGGFNTFIEEQKKQPGTMSVTLVLFDHEYLVPFKNRDIVKVEPLNRKSYVPRGMTALLDAVGRTVNEAGSELSQMKEKDRPEKVIVCILTDGLENASKEFKIEQIKKLIEHQKEKYSWDFVFLAANQDAFEEGGSMGIDAAYTSNFVSDSKGTKDAFVFLNKAVTVAKSKKKK